MKFRKHTHILFLSHGDRGTNSKKKFDTSISYQNRFKKKKKIKINIKIWEKYSKVYIKI